MKDETLDNYFEYRIAIDWEKKSGWTYTPISLTLSKHSVEERLVSLPDRSYVQINASEIWKIDFKGKEVDAIPINYPFLSYNSNQTVACLERKVQGLTKETLPEKVKTKIKELVKPEKTFSQIRIRR